MSGGRRKSLSILGAAVAAVLGAALPSASADDKFWSNPLGGSFHLGINWSGGVAPGPADNAVFNLGSVLPYAVAITSDVSNDQLRVWNDQLELTGALGVDYTLLSTSPLAPSILVGDAPTDIALLRLVDLNVVADGQMVIGAEGSGTVDVLLGSSLKAQDAFIGFVGTGQIAVMSGGTLETDTASMGATAGAFGFGIVDGIDSTWTNAGDLIVGDFGGGDLLITNAGQLESATIFAGFSGDGVINVEDGGLLRAIGAIRIGETFSSAGLMRLSGGGRAESASGTVAFGGGIGDVLVSDPGSSWTVTGPLDIGWSGSGSLTIENGGVVEAGVMTIGGDSMGDGTTTVSGLDSTLDVAGVLFVGGDGKGELVIRNGGIVISGGGIIGDAGSQSNIVSISGSGSAWDLDTNQLVVGSSGTGRLEISAGGSVQSGPLIIGQNLASDGGVILDGAGSSLFAQGQLNVGLEGDGLLQVTNGAQVLGSTMIVGGDPASGASGSGAVVISGTSSTLDLSGSLIVGAGGVGNVTVEAGAELFSGPAVIGDGFGSDGTVDVIGAGSLWNVGAVTVGGDGLGAVRVLGGRVNSGVVEVGTAASGSITVSGSGATWSSAGALLLGGSGSGSLLIENGGQMQATLGVLGGSGGGSTEATILGPGSVFELSDSLMVGFGQSAILTIADGGLVTSSSATVGGLGAGTVVITGPDSRWTAGDVVVADGATGTIAINSGGRLEAGTFNIFGELGVGVVNVSDAASRLVVQGNLQVGSFGSGMLVIDSGAEVLSDSGSVGAGASAAGEVMVSGAGSRWWMGGDFDLGAGGSGLLNISGGGLVHTLTRAFVGKQLLSTGSAMINGAGSRWVIDDRLYIGGDHMESRGSGVVSVAAGGELVAANAVTVWASGTLQLDDGMVSTAIVDLQGGLLSGQGVMTSPVSSTNGRVRINGTMSLTGALNIAAGSQLVKEGGGILHIDGPQNHEPGAMLHSTAGVIRLNTNAGAAATAASAAEANLTLRISDGSVRMGADQDLRNLQVEYLNPGNQVFDLASPAAAGAFRSLRVYPADLTGAKMSLYAAIRSGARIGGAADGILDSARPVHANSAVGIAQLTDPHGDPYILVRLTRIGDLNLDGRVTIADFIDLASHFNGSNATWQEGDLNYDGLVTIADFIDLAANFNSSYSGQRWEVLPQERAMLEGFAAAHGVGVPEPAAVVLMIGVGVGLLASRRRRG